MLLQFNKWVDSLRYYSMRHAISVSSAVLITLLLSRQHAFSPSIWMVLSAFLISLTSKGTPLKQNILFLLCIIIAVIGVGLLKALPIPNTIVMGAIFSCFILTGYIVFLLRFQNKTQQKAVLFFALILLLYSILPPVTLIEPVLINVMLGGAIAVICNQLILPLRLEQEFRHGLVGILRLLADYSLILTELPRPIKKLAEQKNAIEFLLQDQYGEYPIWIFEVGFNPGLRSGFRFFILNLERVMELYFALDYLHAEYFAINEVNSNADVSAVMMNAMQKNAELLHILADYFAYKKLLETNSDFTSDIIELDMALKKVVPEQLELLDIAKDYVILTALVKNIKDVRNLLLQLVMSLPNT